MKKVLVTGGAGFIGSHVVDQLVEQGIKVLIVDNLNTGCREWINPAPLVQFLEADIADATVMQNIFRRQTDIDAVLHLAAQSKVTPSLADPFFDANINILGTINVLECCRQYGVQRLIYASSAAVYGQTTSLPIVEDAPVSPLSPYGVSKYAGEEYVQAYGRLYDIDVSVLRFANVYGPRQSAATEAGVITIFIEALLQGERPVIFGDGRQTRDFIYVQDVAEAILTCLLRPFQYRQRSVYNVSTGRETSVRQLLREICTILAIDDDPHFAQKRPGDIQHSYLDNSRLATDYEWEPQTPMKKGLRQTIEYYRQESCNFRT